MAKAHLKLVAPAIIKRTVTPTRPPNRDLRTREHLTEAEVERLMETAKGNRHGNRDACMVLVAYRHGLRDGGPALGIRWTLPGRSLDRPHGGAPHVHRGLSSQIRPCHSCFSPSSSLVKNFFALTTSCAALLVAGSRSISPRTSRAAARYLAGVCHSFSPVPPVPRTGATSFPQNPAHNLSNSSGGQFVPLTANFAHSSASHVMRRALR